MTNEEKAKEIVGGNWVVFNKEYSAALKMAEWKDQQFNNFLEKKKERELVKKDKYSTSISEENYYAHRIALIDEIINEFFKED